MATDASKRVVDLNAGAGSDLDSEAVLLIDRSSWKTGDVDAKQITYDLVETEVVDAVSDYREDPPASGSWFDMVNIRSGTSMDTWTEVDLSSYVGSVAKAVHVSILLGNFTGGTVDHVYVYYRPANLTDVEDADGMIIYEGNADGTYTNVAFFAVLQTGSGADVGKFDIKVSIEGTATTIGSIQIRIARSDN